MYNIISLKLLYFKKNLFITLYYIYFINNYLVYVSNDITYFTRLKLLIFAGYLIIIYVATENVKIISIVNKMFS